MDILPAPPESHSNSGVGLRLAGSALFFMSAIVAVALSLLPAGWASGSGLIAVAGLIGMGTVFIGVSLAAHVLESRDLADVGALLERAEYRNRVASMVAEEVAAELRLSDLSDGPTSPAA